MLLSNCLARIADRLEESLHQVKKNIFSSFNVGGFINCAKVWFFKGVVFSVVVFPRCGFLSCSFSKVWALLEAEEDAAGLKMKETLEQLHQSKNQTNKLPKWEI